MGRLGWPEEAPEWARLFDDLSGSRRTSQADGSDTTYLWDHRNRLTSVAAYTAAGARVWIVAYRYDLYDRLVARFENTQGWQGQWTWIEKFVYDSAPGKGGLSDVVLVFDGDGAVTNRYLHGPAVDQLFADESAVDGLLWALSDRQGSVRDWAKYDAGSGATSVYNHVEFDAWGQIESQTNAAHRVTAGGYTGRYRDPLTGLQLNGERWYDPRTGTWASRDPSGLDPDVNPYRYVHNGPTNYTDPSGLQAYWPGYRVDNPLFYSPPVDRMKLPIGIGEWSPENFFAYSGIPLEQTKYGCGGMMAVRAGLGENDSPMNINMVPGAMAFGSLADASEYLENDLHGRGLVVALQSRNPYNTQFDGTGTTVLSGKPFQLPGSKVDIFSTSNFCTLQGTDVNPYWEDATNPWYKGGRIRHYLATEAELRDAKGFVIFITVPNTPTVSPRPHALRNRNPRR